MVVTAISGGGVFIGLGTWKTYDITQQNKETKTLKTSVLMVIQELQDLNDLVNTIEPPDSCSVYVGNLEQPNQYKDDQFLIFSSDDEDHTIMRLNAGLIDPGVTAMLNIQNVSGEVAYVLDITEQQSVLLDGEFRIVHVNDNSKELRFALGAFDPDVVRTMSIQAKNGKIAYLSNIPVFTTSFSDAEFMIRGVLDPGKTMTLDISSIAQDTTQTLIIQNVSGIVAYDTDKPWEEGVYNDGNFAVHSVNDTNRQLKFDLGSVSTSSLIEMGVQSISGRVGYLSDVENSVTVDITGDRVFPDAGIEGFSTFQEGGIHTIQLWMCGAGGSGFAKRTPNDAPGVFAVGGGAGGAISGLVLNNVSDHFHSFTIEIGEPTTDFVGTIDNANGGKGEPTQLIAHPISSFVEQMILFADGGEAEYQSLQTGFFGGRGGGVGWGVNSTTIIVEGSSGVWNPVNQAINTTYRLPWIGGAHGSQQAPVHPFSQERTGQLQLNASSTPGGGYRGSNTFDDVPGGAPLDDSHNCDGVLAFGGGGLFGRGGSCYVDISGNAAPNTCAGGGTSPGTTGTRNTDVERGLGGSGRVMLRYWTI